jgi:DNA-binding SARP family transcriptional activator
VLGDDPVLQFAILGPLRVELRGERVALPRSAVLRGLLGVLLAARSQPLTSEELAELVWSGRAEGVRPGSIHVGMSRLRRWLRELPVRAGEAVAVERDTRGYRLLIDAASVDLGHFRDLVRRSGAADRAESRFELLRAATGLRRGPVLADLRGLDFGHPLLRRIEDEMREAGLAMADAASSTGKAQVAVDWLEDVVHREPLDEPAHAALIAALAACGRPADALARYDQLRGRLSDELGVNPSEAVQDAYLAVLAQDRNGPRPRPGLLPPDIADFTGREEQTQLMLSAFAEGASTALKIMTIVGRAGIGKTALAAHVGHLLRDAFSDGQLYVDLHGVDPHPADPADVLARFLRALGIDGPAMPRDLDERAELFRDVLARRRVLVVLDNAADEAQVRPLLPGSPSCGVVVTSRRALTGLSARPVRLDVLDHDAALDLLGRIVGAERIAAEPAAAREIERLCGGLPAPPSAVALARGPARRRPAPSGRTARGGPGGPR